MNRYFVVLFSVFIFMGCSKSNIDPNAAQMIGKHNQANYDAWVKVKYDVDENMKVKNIEFIDSYNSDKEIEQAIINNMNRWKFESKAIRSRYTNMIYINKKPVDELKK